MAKHWFTSDQRCLAAIGHALSIMNSLSTTSPQRTPNRLFVIGPPSLIIIPNGRPPSDKTRVRRHTATADAIAFSIRLQTDLASFPTLGRRRLIRLWNKTRHTRRSSPSCVCRIPVCPTTRYAETTTRQWSRLGMARYNATLPDGASCAFSRQSSEDSASEASSTRDQNDLNLER